jgi:hypothetical protein
MQPVKLNIKNLYQYFSTHPEGAWVMNWQNAFELYKFIKSHDVHKVLDLGTGIGLSASVMALAFSEKGEKDFHIDSVEQFEKCIKLADELIPEPLRANISLHKANPIVWETEQIPYTSFSIHDKLPEGDYDLIINDGPGPFLEDGKYIDLPNGTIHKLLLEGKIKSGTFIVYDGRLTSLRLIERYFGHNFYLHPRTTKGDFNVIERKDNLVECLDDKLPAMEQMGYFRDATK